MRRKLLKILALLVGLLLLAALCLWGRAKWVFDRDYSGVPKLAITADHSPAAVARGELLFQSLCMECHGGADGRATGKHLAEAPEFFGKFYSANLAHPKQGLAQRSDAEIARTLRTGVLPSGQFSVAMSLFQGLGDEDIAALLGYVRSEPPALRPGGELQPPSQLTPAAQLLLAATGIEAPVEGALERIAVPKREPSVEYGRYMATIMDCVGCHTDSMETNADKLVNPEAFAGGSELTDPTGMAIYSKNITMDEATGIGRFSLEDFERVLTRGVRPDGYLVRKPMPLFSRFERVEVEALYRFLKSRPKVHKANKPGGHRLEKASPTDSPEQLFVKVGCVACHGSGAPYQDRLSGAAGKSDEAVAAWILDPQASKPGSIMPAFAQTLDREQATRLAAYVKTLASLAQAVH